MNTVLQISDNGKRRKARAGVTLIEMLIAMLILAMISIGLLHGVMTGVRLNYAAAQRAAAFGLCMDLYEQMRGADYSNVTYSNFPPETIRMTHLGGSQRVPLNCQRSCQITQKASPNRKEVEIEVTWIYMGRTMTEKLNGMVFEKQ